MEVVGVDGCAGGWVAVRITEAGFRDAQRFDGFDALVDAFDTVEIIGVDMPLGLVDRGERAADVAARAMLTGQASSIFSAPARPVLAACTYAEAQAIALRVTGKGLSRQSFALFAKIREVDRHVADARIFEVHPEVSFRLLGGGVRLRRKKSWGGLQRRLALLAAAGIALPADLGAASDVGIDDVVDAAAAAWSARRIATRQAVTFPTTLEQRDASGRGIAIWG